MPNPMNTCLILTVTFVPRSTFHSVFHSTFCASSYGIPKIVIGQLLLNFTVKNSIFKGPGNMAASGLSCKQLDEI